MSPFDAYVMYLALKRHFSSSYDYVKYNGKVSATVASFEKRKDRYMFHKLSKHPDPMGLVVSNMMDDDTKWVGDLFDDQAQSVYNAMKKRRETLSYTFRNELSSIEDLESSMKVVDGDHPPLLKMYLRGKVSPETMIILDDIGGLFDYWSSKILDEYQWPDVKNRLNKYRPFFQYDKAKYREAFSKILDSD